MAIHSGNRKQVISSAIDKLAPIDTLYGWQVVALTLIIQAVSVGILIYSFALFVVPWLDEFGATRSEVMLVIFLQQILIGVMSPFCGRLLDRYSMRILVTIGGVSVASGLFLMSMATSLWQIAIIYSSLFPLGMVLTGPLASQTLVSKWFHGNRGLAIGISAMGTSIGGFAFPLITGHFIAGYGWQQAAVLLSIISLSLVLPATIWILRKSPSEALSSAKNTEDLPNQRLSTKKIMSTRSFWIPVLGLIPINAAFGGIQFNLGAYMKDLGFGQGVAATLISVTAISMIAGKLFFGSMGDKVDHRKLYWLMSALLVCSLLLYLNVKIYEGLLVAAVFQGLATGGVLPMMGIMYISRFGAGSFGKVLGLVNLFVMSGSFGSIFSGWIFDLTGSYSVAFATFIALILPAAISMYWLPEKQPDLSVRS